MHCYTRLIRLFKTDGIVKWSLEPTHNAHNNCCSIHFKGFTDFLESIFLSYITWYQQFCLISHNPIHRAQILSIMNRLKTQKWWNYRSEEGERNSHEWILQDPITYYTHSSLPSDWNVRNQWTKIKMQLIMIKLSQTVYIIAFYVQHFTQTTLLNLLYIATCQRCSTVKTKLSM